MTYGRMFNMSLENHIKNVFQVYRPQRKWKTIYWMVDVHGVILPGSWHRENDFRFINDECQPVLEWISDRRDQKLILWTSSYQSEIEHVVNWLADQCIVVDYVNENPLEEHTKYADFSKKPYFNILIDDKAGFDPIIDWEWIKKTLQEIGEWDKK